MGSKKATRKMEQASSLDASLPVGPRATPPAPVTNVHGPLVSTTSPAARLKARSKLQEELLRTERQNASAAARAEQLAEQAFAKHLADEKAAEDRRAKAATCEAEKGIPCPACGGRFHEVVSTHRSILGRLRRRRECQRCRERFTTYERVHAAPKR
jgi:hypothetical protein